MTTTIQQLQSMTPRQVVSLAKIIVQQCKDKISIGNGLGNDDDFFQAVCELLIEFKLGARELRPGCRLYLAICGLTRGQARGNWMLDRTDRDKDEVLDTSEEHEEYEEGEEDEDSTPALTHSLADIPGLSALDRLLIQHDAHRSAQTSDVATFFGITTRAVRMRKEKLHAQLIARFNLPANFFEEKAEPKLPHLTKKVEVEKDPLANFIPLKPTNFNGFRTVGIR